jgi:hypothetical protein
MGIEGSIARERRAVRARIAGRMTGMGRWTVGLVVLACVAFACDEVGTIVAEDGGASDAGEVHDTVFVPQLDGDGGDDAPMEWDGSPEPDAGDEG